VFPNMYIFKSSRFVISLFVACASIIFVQSGFCLSPDSARDMNSIKGSLQGKKRLLYKIDETAIRMRSLCLALERLSPSDRLRIEHVLLRDRSAYGHDQEKTFDFIRTVTLLFCRQDLNDLEKYAVALYIEEIGMFHQSARDFILLYASRNKDRRLAEWAVDVFSGKLMSADLNTKYPYLYGYEAFYKILKGLLNLKHDIRAEGRSVYCAVLSGTEMRKGSFLEVYKYILRQSLERASGLRRVLIKRSLILAEDKVSAKDRRWDKEAWQGAEVCVLAPRHQVIVSEYLQKSWGIWLKKNPQMYSLPEKPGGLRTEFDPARSYGKIYIKQNILGAKDTRKLNYLILSGIDKELEYLLGLLAECFTELGVSAEEWTINITITNLYDDDLRLAAEVAEKFRGEYHFNIAFIKLDNVNSEQTDAFCDMFRNFLGGCDGIIATLIGARDTVGDSFAERIRDLLSDDGWMITDIGYLTHEMLMRQRTVDFPIGMLAVVSPKKRCLEVLESQAV